MYIVFVYMFGSRIYILKNDICECMYLLCCIDEYVFFWYIYVFRQVSPASGSSDIMQQLPKRPKRKIDEIPDGSKVPRWEICGDGLLCAPDADGVLWAPEQWAFFQHHHQQKAKASTKNGD